MEIPYKSLMRGPRGGQKWVSIKKYKMAIYFDVGVPRISFFYRFAPFLTGKTIWAVARQSESKFLG